MNFTVRPDDLASLNLDTIKDLDEETAVAWKQCLRSIIKDCEDRPGDTKVRELVLKLRIVPIQATSRNYLDEITGEFEIPTPKRPPLVSRPVSLQAQQNGDAIFRRSNPLDINQPGLPFPEGEQEAPSDPPAEGEES